METIPEQIRTRLEALSIADLDVMAQTCGRAATPNHSDKMKIRVEWISTVMTEKIRGVFNEKKTK